jgi:hypothetical protein
VRTMESFGETYPVELLQNYENRMRISEALRYLREAIDWTIRLKNSPEALPRVENDSELSPRSRVNPFSEQGSRSQNKEEVSDLT